MHAIADITQGETRHLIVGGVALDEPELELSGLVGAAEQAGPPVGLVTLAVRDRREIAQIARCVQWLGEHGRSVRVQTRVALPRQVVEDLRDLIGVVVVLEVAHARGAIQRALLGEQADTAAALLLWAQHLKAVGIPVRARIAPLLPGVHERGQLDPLLRNVAAACVSSVELGGGSLDRDRLVSIADAVDSMTLIDLGQALGINTGQLATRQIPEGSFRAAAVTETFLRSMARDAAHDVGLAIVRADAAPRAAAPLVPVGQAELFAS